MPTVPTDIRNRSDQEKDSKTPAYDSIVNTVEELSPLPSDDDMRHIGLNDRQVRLLDGQPNFIRQEVYDEALRLLMERDSTHDSLSSFFILS